MTRSRVSLDAAAAVRDWPADLSGADRAGGPIIVMTYPHAGGEELSSLLAQDPALACTIGTGILPLCEQASAAWRAVDGRPLGPPSQLAKTSTLVLATSMITALLARHGKRRWCEVAIAAPEAAGTFALLFPGTRIVCLHRACPGVVRAALSASPWGLAGPAFASFTSAYPASTAAALGAYWAAHTSSLLSFEQAHPGICHRVRYEDLDGNALTRLQDFLALEGPGRRPPAWLYQGDDEAATSASNATSQDAAFPAEQLPPALLKRANGLMKELGYPPMGLGTVSARARY